MKDPKPKEVEEYINSFPNDVRELLDQIRSIIKQTAPEAEETISYAMPAYKLNKRPLVYFAAYEKHIGFYGTPSGHAKFAKELAKYKQGKGSVQFPLDRPLPLDMIEKIVKFRVSENERIKLPLKKSSPLYKDAQTYNDSQSVGDKAICDLLSQEIDRHLPEAENKIWHRHPVWFLDGNPTVGYSKQKAGIRLMFWSGADFDEDALDIKGKKFKDASIFFNDISEIKKSDLKRWLKKCRDIQWDYKNIVKRKGRLERLV